MICFVWMFLCFSGNIFAQNPVRDFPIDKIKINGKKPNTAAVGKSFLLVGNSVDEEMIYLFNENPDEKVIKDSSMKSWISFEQFEKADSVKLRTYWMGLEIQMPEQLFAHVFFLPVPNPYVDKIYINNQLVYDLVELKKSGKDWISMQSMIPVNLNKPVNRVFFHVNFTEEHAVFSLKGGGILRSYPQLMDDISNRTNFTSLISGLAVFYSTVTLLYFLLYFLGIRESNYLWGALFTVSCGSSLFLLSQLAYGYGVYSPAIFISLGCIILFTPITFMLFISSFFHYPLPRIMKKSFLITAIAIGLAEISDWMIDIDIVLSVTGFIAVISSLVTLLLSLFYPIRFVILAIREKKENAKIILFGMFAPLVLMMYSIIEMNIFNKSFIATDFFTAFLIIPVPLSILVSLVRDYSSANRSLTLQLTKVEELTAQALHEQEEKQRILSDQNNLLETQVKERTFEIVQQKKIVEEKNHEILDSITYARRIQQAILPPLRLFKQIFPDSFVLYKPKDIVAGDFYWLQQKKGCVYFAAADCTGHGVPGAMVSVVCNNALNRCINEFALTDTGEILDKARSIVIEEFEKSDQEVKDGMDISFCALSGNVLNWSGANNPLWIIRKGATEVEEVKPNKQPIGKFAEMHPFSSHRIELAIGDIFYLFSDGYQDQFGGPKGKKFKATQLKQLLLSCHELPMNEQQQLVEKTFEDWRRNTEQVDDVCIIGIRC